MHACMHACTDVCTHRFICHTFGQQVKVELPEGLAAPRRESFLTALFRTSRPRSSVRGGADPSSLCGETIAGEEDVLHAKELPSFDGKLSTSSAELLVSFLTVPYVRIPLVLNLLAAPENLNALSHPDMQRLLDSVLFEPGLSLARSRARALSLSMYVCMYVYVCMCKYAYIYIYIYMDR